MSKYEERDAGGQKGGSCGEITGPRGPASFVPSRLYVETLSLRHGLPRGLLLKKRERRLQRERMMIDDVRHNTRVLFYSSKSLTY
jgi:hypothetical protein